MGGRPFFHRHGVLFDATFTTPTGEQRALVRVSRSFGWPEPFPEWVGFAVRLFDDERGELDLILASSAPEPDLWRQLRPSRDVLACTFTSKMPYLVNGAASGCVVTAVPLDGRSAGFDEVFGGEVAPPIRYRVQTGHTRGVWHPWGELHLHELRPDEPSIRFHPPVEPPSTAARFRRRVYDWIQRER